MGGRGKARNSQQGDHNSQRNQLQCDICGDCLYLKGGKPGTKRATRGEYLTAKDFIAAFDTVREWDDIHTGNVKPYIKRQQTPFIALLHCAGILE